MPASPRVTSTALATTASSKRAPASTTASGVSLSTPAAASAAIAGGTFEGYGEVKTRAPYARVYTADDGTFRVGDIDVGGVEMIGYNRETGKYVSYFYDSRGNVSEHEIVGEGDKMSWKGEITGCTAVFTENGKVQTANHVRLDENGQWVPSMKVVLRKVD